VFESIAYESFYDSILFDFDGVLADTEPVHFECWAEVLAPFGIELSWPYYERECIGVADWVMLERIGEARRPPVSAGELWPSYTLKKKRFQDKIEAEPPLLPGTINLIRELQPFYKLAVVSSSDRSEVEPPLVRAGIRDCFQAFVCGMEVLNLKPAPDPYLRAAELLAVRSPLVVEDSDAGVAAGIAAGFEVLRVSRPELLGEEVRGFLNRRTAR
jgi:HAD superfamily hydrolase (TIGR01509 family)